MLATPNTLTANTRCQSSGVRVDHVAHRARCRRCCTARRCGRGRRSRSRAAASAQCVGIAHVESVDEVEPDDDVARRSSNRSHDGRADAARRPGDHHYPFRHRRPPWSRAGRASRPVIMACASRPVSTLLNGVQHAEQGPTEWTDAHAMTDAIDPDRRGTNARRAGAAPRSRSPAPMPSTRTPTTPAPTWSSHTDGPHEGVGHDLHHRAGQRPVLRGHRGARPARGRPRARGAGRRRRGRSGAG